MSVEIKALIKPNYVPSIFSTCQKNGKLSLFSHGQRLNDFVFEKYQHKINANFQHFYYLVFIKMSNKFWQNLGIDGSDECRHAPKPKLILKFWFWGGFDSFEFAFDKSFGFEDVKEKCGFYTNLLCSTTKPKLVSPKQHFSKLKSLSKPIPKPSLLVLVHV